MRIFLAVLAYDGKIETQCADSILKGTHLLRDEGHTVMPLFYSGDCYLDRARNACIDRFLNESICDCIIFIDSDVGFAPDALSKLIKYDKPIVGGVYPFRGIEGYPVVLKYNENNNCQDEETKMATVLSTPTGFLKINRSVFEDMISHYEMSKDTKGLYPFFETGLVFEDGVWYGEDVVFCKKWNNMGGEIFVETDIDFNHSGSKGNYYKYLTGNYTSVMNLDKVNDGIRGWMSDAELSLLAELASKSNSIIEIGSWKGRSTNVLLDNCKGIVTAIDHWQGSSTDESSIIASAHGNIFQEFLNNVKHHKNLSIMKGDSIEMSKAFSGKVDFVFIDAGHTYEECKADILAWLPKCVKVIAGHDYSDSFPGVKDAVNEIFGEVNVKDSIWWIEL